MKFKLKHGTCCNTSRDYEDEEIRGANMVDALHKYVECDMPDGGSCEVRVESEAGEVKFFYLSAYKSWSYEVGEYSKMPFTEGAKNLGCRDPSWKDAFKIV